MTPTYVQSVELTGAIPEGFQLQLKALENLIKCKVTVHPACMISFSPPENIAGVEKEIKGKKTPHLEF